MKTRPVGANPLLYDLTEEPFPVHAREVEISNQRGLRIAIRPKFLTAQTTR
jgi:hypothetical protein